MPHPRVVEMRRRLWPLLELALRARDSEEAEKILDEFTEGKISYKEAERKLKALAEAR